MLTSAILHVVLTATLAAAHVIVTYPGCRGNNFVTNSSFPYGMQWMYPCGGLTVSTNRTFWPVKGGPLAFQPGWFSGHAKALLYVNIGFDTDAPDGGPMNWTTQLVPAFQLLGPSNGPYPGTICLKHVAVPESLGVKAGQNATIQVVEIAAHGASLFGCSDITFVDEGDERIPPLNDSTCFNTQELGFADVYTVTTQKPIFKDGSQAEESGAETISFWYMKRHMTHSPWRIVGWLPVILGGLWVFL